MRNAVLRYCGIAVFAGSLLAQNQRTTGTIMVWAAPSGVCLANSPMEYYSAGNQYWGCSLPTITSLTGTWSHITGGGGGSGTVTSAGFATNLGTVSGSPITVSGTITNTVAAADVVGLFSACSGVQYLGADGACHAPSGGATIPNTTNIIKGDGSGNGADSGYVAQNASTSLTGFLTSTDWNTFNGKGSVSSVATGCGASGGTITTTGTILGIGDCVTIANETGTGTTTNKLVKLTGAPSKVIITGTGDTTGIIGVCDSACGTTGSAVIQQSGLHITTVDGGGSTAGHWAQPSTSIAGDTMDSGLASTSAPPMGSIGIYLQTFGGLSTVVTDLINNLAGSVNVGTVTHTGALSADEPVFGNGADDIKVGTKSGNTNEVMSATGSFVSGNCLKADSNGNSVDAGVACGGGGGVAVVSPPYISAGGNLYCGTPLQSCTAPVSGSFAWSNQPTGATETANGSALIVHTIPNASIAWAVRSQDISPNTTLDTLFAVTMNFADYSRCGVGFLESGTTKMVTFTMLAFGAGTLWGTEAWSSYTGFTAPITQSSVIIMPQSNMRVRLKYDGTNIYFYVSNDGVSWLEFFQEAKATHFTTAPDKWFYGCDSQNSSTTSLAGDDYIELLHWVAF